MKKKIEIISLSLILFVATTGIPMYYHYCQMMESSFSGNCSSCLLCELPEENNNDCCSATVNYFNQVTLSSLIEDCCSNEFVYNKIDDEIIFNKNELNQKLSQSGNSFIILVFDNFEFNSFTKSDLTDSSPPSKFITEAYISNCSLLI